MNPVDIVNAYYEKRKDPDFPGKCRFCKYHHVFLSGPIYHDDFAVNHRCAVSDDGAVHPYICTIMDGEQR